MKELVYVAAGLSRIASGFRCLTSILLKQGLDYAIYTIYLYRVAVDHYTLNPTKVILTSKPWIKEEKEVEINDVALEIVLELAYNILEYLEKY